MTQATTMIQGAHRGGRTLVARLAPSAATRMGPRVLLADPQEGRARSLGVIAAQRFPSIDVISEERSGAEAMAHVAEDATLLLVSDTAGGIHDTLTRRHPGQGALWQLVGRGPGGASGRRFGLQGTLVPRDHDGAHASKALLGVLDRLAPPRSSKALTAADPLTAQVLAPMRDAVTAQTAAQLALLHRAPEDLPFGPLTLHGGRAPYPMIVRAVDTLRIEDRVTRVLDAAAEVPLAQRRVSDRRD